MVKLLKVIIEGFGIYKERQVVDFSGLPDNALIGIFGENSDGDGGYDSNGSGKSTFTNAISWCKFEKIPIQGESQRAITKEMIVNHESKKALVGLVYNINDSIVEIETSMTMKGSKSIKLTIDGKSFIANTPTQVRDKFYSLLGIGGKDKTNFNDFLNRCYFSGDVTKSFASKNFSAQNRYAIVAKVRKLEIYDIAIKNCADKIDSINQVLDEKTNFQTQLSDSLIEDFNLDEANEELDDLQQKISMKELLKAEISVELQKYEQVGAINARKKEFDQQLDLAKQQVDQQYNAIVKVVDTLNGYKKRNIELEENKSKIDLNPKIELELKTNKQDLQNSIIDSNLRIKTIDADIKHKQKEIENLESQHYLVCPKCKADLLIDDDSLLTVDVEKVQNLIARYRDSIAVLQKEKVEINKELTKLNTDSTKTQKELEVFVSNRTKLEEIDKELTRIEKDFEGLLEKYQEYIFEDETGTIIPDESIKIYESYSEINELLLEIEKVEIELKAIAEIKYTVNDLNEVNQTLLSYSNFLNEKKEIRDKQVFVREQLDAITESIAPFQAQIDNYEYWEEGFQRLKNIELIEVEPELENATNDVLQRLGTNMTVNYHVDVENAGLLINLIEDSGNELPLELFSTGQSNRIGLAAGLALSEISLGSTSDYGFSMWDEVLDGLDNTGQDLFFDILREKEGLKLVITHDRKLQGLFEHKLKVIRKDHSSKIVLEA